MAVFFLNVENFWRKGWQDDWKRRAWLSVCLWNTVGVGGGQPEAGSG